MWVLVGRLRRKSVSPLVMIVVIVGAILEEISPLPARDENPGLGIPMDRMAIRFLCTLLLASEIPVRCLTVEDLTHLLSMCASVAWKLAMRALLLPRGTPPAK